MRSAKVFFKDAFIFIGYDIPLRIFRTSAGKRQYHQTSRQSNDSFPHIPLPSICTCNRQAGFSCLTGFLFSLEELFRLILKQSLVIGYQLLADHRFRFLKQYSLMHTCAQKQLFLRDLHNNHVHIVSDLRAG